jgi:hypothetical protein
MICAELLALLPHTPQGWESFTWITSITELWTSQRSLQDIRHLEEIRLFLSDIDSWKDTLT